MATLQIAVIPVTMFQQNCAIVWDKDTRDCMVVDPGGEPGRIADALSRLDLLPQTEPLAWDDLMRDPAYLRALDRL